MRIRCSHSPTLVFLTFLAFLLAIGQTRSNQGFPRRWPGSSYGRVETSQKNDPEPYNYYNIGARDYDNNNRQGYESDEDPLEQQPPQTFRVQHEQRRFQPDLKQEFKLQSSVAQYAPVKNWPSSEVTLGQISAVTFDNAGNVVLFQRGDHEWDATTFNATDNYLKIEQGPIKANTLITYDADSGKVVHQWGADLFYMPHGITIDEKGYIFLTDVALHQVFKFPPRGGDGKPLLVLGTRWENGNDRNHFCKPSAVAVTKGGDFFVADGYCNHRIVKFDKNGEYLMKIGQRTWTGMQQFPPPYAFSVPHALALAEEKNIICVADRENGRIQCFHINNGTYVGQIALRDFGHRLFSIAYTPVQGGLIYAVNGPDLYGKNLAVQGFVIGIASQQLVTTFAPPSGTFSNPHDLAVSYDSNEVYVVELNPHQVWKFINKNAVNSTIQRVEIKSPESFTHEPTITVEVTEDAHQVLPMIEESPHYLPQSVEALIVVAALVSISMLAIIFVLVKKRGPCCYWFRYKKWQYKRGHTETFKLGNLLDPTAGFQLVGQEMSDEEEIDDESGSDSATKRSFNNSYIANA